MDSKNVPEQPNGKRFFKRLFFFVTIHLINFMYTLNNVIEIVFITSDLRICERTVKNYLY